MYLPSYCKGLSPTQLDINLIRINTEPELESESPLYTKNSTTIIGITYPIYS